MSPPLICHLIFLQHTYYHLDLSLLKALGRPDASIPSSVCVVHPSSFSEVFTIAISLPSSDCPRVFRRAVPRNHRRLPESTPSQRDYMGERNEDTVRTHTPTSHSLRFITPPLLRPTSPSVHVGKSTIWMREWDLQIL
jgi:hypothetical protein